MRSNGVEHDVTNDAPQIGPVLDDNGAEPRLEQMTGSIVSSIRCLAEYSIDVLHRVGKISTRRIEDQVVMVVHQTRRIAPDGVAVRGALDRAEQALAVSVIFEYPAFAVAARHDMVDGAGNL